MVIENNVIAFGQNGGIHVEGYDDKASESIGSVPFARIVNNTIYGTATASNSPLQSDVNFENIPDATSGTLAGTGVKEGLSINDPNYLINDNGTNETISQWITTNYGVTISFQDGSNPLLVQTGDQIHTPPNGTGYAFDNPNVEGDTLNNGQPDIGQFFLTNQDHHNGPTSPLELTYSTPSAFASGMLLDIDGNEKWTVEAFDTNGNPILVNGKTLQTFTAGDKGTGNGVATYWHFGPYTTAIIGRIEITYTGSISGRGLGFDNFIARGIPNTGILVDKNASPTILNNVIANTDTAIKVYNDPLKTPDYTPTAVVGATAYYNNTNNAKYVDASGNLGDNVPETFAIQLSTSPFVNAAAGNFYPVSTVKDASGNTIPNPIIDSSVDSLADRPNMVSVRNPIGLPLSPILAPCNIFTARCASTIHPLRFRWGWVGRLHRSRRHRARHDDYLDRLVGRSVGQPGGTRSRSDSQLRNRRHGPRRIVPLVQHSVDRRWTGSR